MSQHRRPVLAALLVLATVPARLEAQPLVSVMDGTEAASTVSGANGPGGGAACRPSMLDRRLTLATIAAEDVDRHWKTAVPERAWPSLHLMSELVALYVRGHLGARDGQMPVPSDSVFNWAMLNGHVHVVAYRDGGVKRWLSADVPGHAPRRSWQTDAGERLIAFALDSAMGAGEAFTWPEGVKADSIAFVLRWAWPLPTRDTLKFEPMQVRHAAPVAPLRVPAVLGVGVRRGVTPDFPYFAARARAQANLRMRYTVDTTGRAVPASVEDVWDPGAPTLKGRHKRYYEQFVAAARKGILETEYEPAIVGRCVVPMRVEQEFTYRLR